MSFEQQEPGGPVGPESEEELRAAYEAEIKKIRVEHVLLEQIVSLVNLGMRRTGLAPGTEDERDVAQVKLAIESVRALLPLIEQTGAPQAGQIREALSQLQLAFVRLGGPPDLASTPAPATETEKTPGGPSSAPPPGAPAGPPPAPGVEKPEPGGPAQRSGRLWIPGQ
jgi:hypothetical protein